MILTKKQIRRDRNKRIAGRFSKFKTSKRDQLAYLISEQQKDIKNGNIAWSA